MVAAAGGGGKKGESIVGGGESALDGRPQPVLDICRRLRSSTSCFCRRGRSVAFLPLRSPHPLLLSDLPLFSIRRPRSLMRRKRRVQTRLHRRRAADDGGGARWAVK